MARERFFRSSRSRTASFLLPDTAKARARLAVHVGLPADSWTAFCSSEIADRESITPFGYRMLQGMVVRNPSVSSELRGEV